MKDGEGEYKTNNISMYDTKKCICVVWLCLGFFSVNLIVSVVLDQKSPKTFHLKKPKKKEKKKKH